MTSGTNIDQLYSLDVNLAVGTDWSDVGIEGGDLATGSYMIQVFVDNYAQGGGQYDTFYTGSMSWFSTGVNSAFADNHEIVLHSAGHLSAGRTIYLRTTKNTSTNRIKLQIASDDASTSVQYKFKIRRLI